MKSGESLEWQLIAEQSIGEDPQAFTDAMEHLTEPQVTPADVALKQGSRKLTHNDEAILARCPAADIYAANPDGTLDF